MAANGASTIEEHISGIADNSKFDVHVHRGRMPFAGDLGAFDSIILHYTLIAYPFRNDNMVSPEFRYQLVQSTVPKIAIVQDDYRAIFERVRFFNFIGINHVFTLGNLQVREKIYPSFLCNFTTSQILTGYSDNGYQNWPNNNWKERTIDLGYRARLLPPWMGELGTYKSEIIQLVKKNPATKGLNLDLSTSESSRIYGQDWVNFLCNTKIALGTESGSSTLDYDGRFSDQWTVSNSTSQGIAKPLDFDYGVISPRIFEYSAARCLMALTDGEYSGVVKPWEHYFPLRKDLTNFQKLIDFSKDERSRTEMIERSYKHLISSGAYSYKSLAEIIDNKVFELISKRNISLSGFSSSSNVSSVNKSPSSPYEFQITSFKERLIHSAKFLYFRIKPLSLRLLVRKLVFRLYSLLKPAFSLLIFYLVSVKRVSQICNRAEIKIRKKTKVTLALEFQTLDFFIQEAHKMGVELKQRTQGDLYFLEWAGADYPGDKLVEFPKLTFSAFHDEEGFFISKGLYSNGNPPFRLKRFSTFKDTNPTEFDKFLRQTLIG
jgi:hypothetical protein